MVRRRTRTGSEQGTDHVSLRDDDFSSLHVNCCDSAPKFWKRKRQRTDLKKTDERQGDAYAKKYKKTEGKTGDNEGEDGKDGEDSIHEICVITWNVQCDFLSGVVQGQANVAMFQESQNWHPDGAAEELGRTLLQEQKEGKAAIAVKRQNMGLMRHVRHAKRWVLVVLESILFLSMYPPHTWSGEVNLEKSSTRRCVEVPDLWHHCWNGWVSGGEAKCLLHCACRVSPSRPLHSHVSTAIIAVP